MCFGRIALVLGGADDDRHPARRVEPRAGHAKNSARSHMLYLWRSPAARAQGGPAQDLHDTVVLNTRIDVDRAPEQ